MHGLENRRFDSRTGDPIQKLAHMFSVHLGAFNLPEGSVAGLRRALPFRHVGHDGGDGTRRLRRVQRRGRPVQEGPGRLREDVFEVDRHGACDVVGWRCPADWFTDNLGQE